MTTQRTRKRDLVFIAGVTGAGKTYFNNRMLLTYPRVILLSPIEAEEREYTGIHLDRFDDLLSAVREVQENKQKEFRFILSDLSQFPEVCAFVYDLGYEYDSGVMFAIEEAQRIIPAKGSLCSEFQDIIYRGRHPQVSLAIVSQRFSTVSIEARSQWRKIVSFRQTEPRDIDWLYQTTGDNRALAVNELPDHKYIEFP